VVAKADPVLIKSTANVNIAGKLRTTNLRATRPEIVSNADFNSTDFSISSPKTILNHFFVPAFG
jgi:hypothetical protein